MNNYIVPYAELLSLYDPNDEQSVVDHAKKLLGKSLYPYIGNTQVSESNTGKGDFGNLLEEAYFKVRNNNESRPDIPECGIEIKSGQVNLVRGT